MILEKNRQTKKGGGKDERKGQQVKFCRYTSIRIQKRLRKSIKEQARKDNTSENVSKRERKEKTGK
jgi:hypothetical protein